MKLLKSYFNAQISKEFSRIPGKTGGNKTKIKPMARRYKRLSTKRTFVGRGHLKHTSNKVLITFFVYNTEGMFLSSLFKAMKKKTLFPGKFLKEKNIFFERNGDITRTYNR